MSGTHNVVDCAVDSNPIGDMQWRREYNDGTVRNVTDIVQGTLYSLVTYYFYWCSFGKRCVFMLLHI